MNNSEIQGRLSEAAGHLSTALKLLADIAVGISPEAQKGMEDEQCKPDREPDARR